MVVVKFSSVGCILEVVYSQDHDEGDSNDFRRLHPVEVRKLAE